VSTAAPTGKFTLLFDSPSYILGMVLQIMVTSLIQ